MNAIIGMILGIGIFEITDYGVLTWQWWAIFMPSVLLIRAARRQL